MESSAAEAEPSPKAAKAESRWQPVAVPFAAALLVLTASFANFLGYHGYSALRPEVLIVWAGLAAAAAVFAGLHSIASNFGKAVLDGFLVFLAVDLNSDFTLAAAGLAGAVAALRLGRGLSLLEPLSIIAAVVLAASAVGATETRPAIARTEAKAGPATDRPAILHVVLDEHGGTGGIADPAFRRQLSDFYTDRGFRLFERAYSRHFHTVNAIPDVLNFGSPGDSRNVNETLDVGRTTYLSELERQGYRLNFYQSDFADFCRYSRYASCTAYWSPSLALVEAAPIAATEKARLMGFKFASLSKLLQAITNGIDNLTHLPVTRPLGIPVLAIKERGVSGSLGGFAILDRMAADLQSAQRGNVYFAHVMAPHYPYAKTSDCTLLPPSRWEYRRSSRPVAVREAAYRRQIGCLLRHMDKVVDAFLSSPAGRDGVVIIHGDHGSRITGLEPIEPNEGRLTPADLMAGYSTLFAVRGPGVAPGVEPTPMASPAILRRLAASGFASAEGIPAGDGKVYLDGPNWAVGKPTSIKDVWPAAD